MRFPALKGKAYSGHLSTLGFSALCGAGALALAVMLIFRPALAEQASVRQLKIASTTYMGRNDPKWGGLLSHLDRTLNARCEFVEVKDNLQIMTMFKKRQVEFAYMTPIDYLQANRLLQAEAIAIQLTPDGKPGYYSVLIAKKSSGIQTLDQAKGKKLGFVLQDSVSGFKIPVYCILKERKQPLSSFFPQTVFAGDHVKVVEGLWRGDFEVGATNTKDLKNSCKMLGLDPNLFNIIWKSGFIPESVFVARSDLPLEMKDSFANALISFSRDKEGIKTLNIGGFTKPDGVDFSLIKDLDAYLQKEKITY